MAIPWRGVLVLYSTDEISFDLNCEGSVLVTGLTVRRRTHLLSGRLVSVTVFINVNYSASVMCSVQS
jgi:hypothetical protein